MQRYSIEPRTRKYVTGYGFLSFARKHKKQLLNTGLNTVKTASKKQVSFWKIKLQRSNDDDTEKVKR